MKFSKYHGAGNDFVLIDQRHDHWVHRADTAQIARLCHRRFGIGADGLILLQNRAGYDFEMIYFNADGREGSMCGNGGRCIVAFAHQLGLVEKTARFWATDGEHEARISPKQDKERWVELKMNDVQQVEVLEPSVLVLNTGSPHYISFVPSVKNLDVVSQGREIRYSDRFRADGINVNFVSETLAGLDIRTYERGVEDETLACGTGVTAAAIAACLRQKRQPGPAEIPVRALGGDLSVRLQVNADGSFSDIWLCGPAAPVFEGTL